MRRKDREQPREFALSVIDQSDYAVLAAVDEAGAPYCVPLTLAREGDALYFHCALEGLKLDILRVNPKVCVSFVCEAVTNEQTYSVKYASAIATGTAHIIEDEAEKLHALRLLCARHAPSNPDEVQTHIDKNFHRTAIVRIDMESLTAKANT